jgi:glycosyltransferase involved in cell wall biosynthesis
MHAVIRGLRAHGHSVRPFLATGEHPPPASPSPGRAWVRRIAPAPVRLTGRDLLEYLHDRRLERPVMNACREFEPDAIYERTEIHHSVGARVAWRLDVPLVLEINGPLVEERAECAGLLSPSYARHLESAKCAAADHVVTVSAALSGYLAGQGVEPSKIHAIPNGVDPAVFHPDRAHPAAVRMKLGLGRRLVIGFVGAFADWHGLETLVTAVAEVARSGALDLHLLMVGEGASRLALRDLARRVGLEGRVSLPGSVAHDQVPHYLAAMDICILPAANWYMSPIKLFEYGAMGRPIIAPHTSAVAEVMTDGEDGLLVTPGSSAELARAILYQAQHPEERAAMAATFQQRVRRRHTWMMVAGRVSLLLEQSVQARQLSIAAGHPWAEAEGGDPENETIEEL